MASSTEPCPPAVIRYVDDYGIGPCDIYEFNPDNAKDLRAYSQPFERARVLRKDAGT